MDNHWMPLQSFPVGGSALRIDDPSFWQGLLDEFGMGVRIVDPIDAHITVLPQTDGVLFRGKIRGRVCMTCDRCSGESMISLSHSFDSFEPFPREAAPAGTSGAPLPDEDPEEADEAVIRVAAHGKGIEINPAALAWQEFSLVLPVKPLCGQDCKGLCPFCGCNKNTDECSCDTGGNDPRLAVLRGLTIQKK